MCAVDNECVWGGGGGRGEREREREYMKACGLFWLYTTTYMYGMEYGMLSPI